MTGHHLIESLPWKDDAETSPTDLGLTGFGVFVVPLSWAVGRWDKGSKTLWSLGPVRFFICRGLGPWKGK